jgi:hypothetical protein
MNKKHSVYPCPICQRDMTIVGTDEKGKKIGSCGHAWRFKGTKSSKMLDRKYVKTKWGLELKS